MEIKIWEAVLSDAPVIAAFNVRLAEESEVLRLDVAGSTFHTILLFAMR